MHEAPGAADLSTADRMRSILNPRFGPLQASSGVQEVARYCSKRCGFGEEEYGYRSEQHPCHDCVLVVQDGL